MDDMIISPRHFPLPPEPPRPPPRFPLVVSWVVQWDSDWRLFLFGPDSIWHTANVISFYHRHRDPTGAFADHLRMIMQLDRPSATPRFRLRAWAVRHTAATVVTVDKLACLRPTAVYIQRRGGFRLVSGCDVLAGGEPDPLQIV